LRPLTQATLIALLSATGLRISEALKLKVADVTGDGLLIRETKFRKTRLVPLHDTAAAGLARYLVRRQPCSHDEPMFTNKRGQALRYIAVKETFDRLLGKAGVRSRRARRPRLHDLRHTFAVRALQGSPIGRPRSTRATLPACWRSLDRIRLTGVPPTSAATYSTGRDPILQDTRLRSSEGRTRAGRKAALADQVANQVYRVAGAALYPRYVTLLDFAISTLRHAPSMNTFKVRAVQPGKLSVARSCARRAL
jgi:hypothetical protein